MKASHEEAIAIEPGNIVSTYRCHHLLLWVERSIEAQRDDGIDVLRILYDDDRTIFLHRAMFQSHITAMIIR